MSLPKISAFPVFVENEMSRVIVVLVQVVVDATFFRPGDVDELGEFCFDKVDLAGVGFDVGDNGQLGHQVVPLLFR